jgi:hypothetical protein
MYVQWTAIPLANHMCREFIREQGRPGSNIFTANISDISRNKVYRRDGFVMSPKSVPLTKTEELMIPFECYP